MSKSLVGRLAALVLAAAAVVAVAVLAYRFGVDHADRFRPVMRGAAFRDSGFEPGAWLLGLVVVGLIALFIVWLVADRLSARNLTTAAEFPVAPLPAAPISVPNPPVESATATADLDRLRELADLHTTGKLTDEEFSAAKRRLLGL
jgi:hypothetical protein